MNILLVFPKSVFLSSPFVSTSHMTSEQIDKHWHELEQLVLDEGLSTYFH